jgi:hypothetical protein
MLPVRYPSKRAPRTVVSTWAFQGALFYLESFSWIGCVIMAVRVGEDDELPTMSRFMCWL